MIPFTGLGDPLYPSQAPLGRWAGTQRAAVPPVMTSCRDGGSENRTQAQEMTHMHSQGLPVCQPQLGTRSQPPSSPKEPPGGTSQVCRWPVASSCVCDGHVCIMLGHGCLYQVGVCVPQFDMAAYMRWCICTMFIYGCLHEADVSVPCLYMATYV